MDEYAVVWADAARIDLRALVFYIHEENPAAAVVVADRLQNRAAKLATLPERGREVPELASVGEHRYRELVERPWRIIYRVGTSQVHVVAVVDGRRDLNTWFHEQVARFQKAGS